MSLERMDGAFPIVILGWEDKCLEKRRHFVHAHGEPFRRFGALPAAGHLYVIPRRLTT